MKKNYQKLGKINGSGYTKLINIINVDVNAINAPNKTGAVERYFKKSFIIQLIFQVNLNL